ncbi:ORF089 [Spodoptera frugiperda granulovirus]|uniref:ORF089 n=1 Tax=Spodoptera frugiperda granulovirus TaxID=307454 RepID=A0A0C5B356_9BBAC|nr:ORF089 [Spodoptera frugiperda granulovirus]AJK91750.1 ORF089 [Spodoptera frugiperda granulovirus]
MSKVVYYQANNFKINDKLILLSQHLMQDDETKTKMVMDDLVNNGYSLCVVADRKVEEEMIDRVTKKKYKIDKTNQYRQKMRRSLIRWGYPVKFASIDHFKGLSFDVDTDEYDRIDYKGPVEDVLVTLHDGRQSVKKLPEFICNDYIRNYYNIIKKQ